jgi:hypothetical protein
MPLEVVVQLDDAGFSLVWRWCCPPPTFQGTPLP